MALPTPNTVCFRNESFCFSPYGHPILLCPKGGPRPGVRTSGGVHRARERLGRARGLRSHQRAGTAHAQTSMESTLQTAGIARRRGLRAAVTFLLFFPSRLLSWSYFSSSLPFVTQVQGHIAGASPPFPPTVRRLPFIFFFHGKSSSLFFPRRLTSNCAYPR